MSRRLADVLRGPLVPVVVVGMAAALDTPPSPLPLLTVARTAPLSPQRPALEGGGKSPGRTLPPLAGINQQRALLARAEAL